MGIVHLVDALLSVREVFPEALAAEPVFRDLLHGHAGRLLSRQGRRQAARGPVSRPSEPT